MCGYSSIIVLFIQLSFFLLLSIFFFAIFPCCLYYFVIKLIKLRKIDILDTSNGHSWLVLVNWSKARFLFLELVFEASIALKSTFSWNLWWKTFNLTRGSFISNKRSCTIGSGSATSTSSIASTGASTSTLQVLLSLNAY